MSTDFFDKEELENLPPAERAKIIKKKKEELEKQLEEEAKDLEKKSLDELERQKEELDEIIEQELDEQKKRFEEAEQKRNASELESTIQNSPEADEKANTVEYGVHSDDSSKMLYETGGAGTDSMTSDKPNMYENNSSVKSREEELGSRFYVEKPKNDYL